MAKRGLEHVQSWRRRAELDIPVGIGLVGATAAVTIPLGAAAVYTTRSWPFYRQPRPWRPDEDVNVIKFQTIPPGPKDRPMQVQGVKDDRAHPVAQWMRDTSLDELPQGFNILGGSMSAVGPRPVLNSTLEGMEAASPRLFAEWHPQVYQTVRPGEFGPAQLYRRGHAHDVGPAAVSAAMEIDLRYFLDTATMASDWGLVGRTSAYLLHVSSTPPEQIVQRYIGPEPLGGGPSSEA
jgi:lipopolysaccharide/colanic/teichoic acid biosynthesis glycosyltransferase